MATGPGDWQAVPVRGFRMGTTMAGIRHDGRRDLVVMGWDAGSSVAGVFTRNRFCAAPVLLARERLRCDPRYFLVNTGNANAGTGEAGLLAARQTCAVLSDLSDVDESQVLPFSTGVIGQPLPVDKIGAAIPLALADLREDNWPHAARGIMTTDTRSKGCTRQFNYAGVTCTVSGISKGAGMIKPDMATMLAYIATDAAVEQAFLQQIMTEITNQSFNRITVDGDMSTNDSFMVVATGAAGNDMISSRGSELAKKLIIALREVAVELAQAIVRDGEGASKFVTVRVEEAKTRQDALAVAYTVAHSPLVKTALFASDPNWGRILAAVGQAPVACMIIDRLSIWLDKLPIVEHGQPAAQYNEEAGQQVMGRSEIMIRINLGVGSATEEVWTTDLSYEYIKINADYRS